MGIVCEGANLSSKRQGLCSLWNRSLHIAVQCCQACTQMCNAANSYEDHGYWFPELKGAICGMFSDPNSTQHWDARDGKASISETLVWNNIVEVKNWVRDGNFALSIGAQFQKIRRRTAIEPRSAHNICLIGLKNVVTGVPQSHNTSSRRPSMEGS